MEGEMMRKRLIHVSLSIALSFAMAWTTLATAQESSESAQAEISLRRSAQSRTYQGREVEGEERQIAPGDTLWRILVQEKGVAQQNFRSYLVVIRGTNPQLKNPEILRVGDKLFIPLRAEQIVNAKGAADAAPAATPAGPATTVNYRVKPGEHLYQILREQLKLTDDRKVSQYYALVKDLNPERKSWETLVEGDVIRLPNLGQSGQVAAASTGRSRRPAETNISAQRRAEELLSTAQNQPVQIVQDRQRAMQAPAKDNFDLFSKVAEAVGGEVQQSGEESIAIKDGNIRFDKNTYPVVYNAALGQRVVLDRDGKIPASLRGKLAEPNVGMPIVSMANGASVKETVSQLLANLGYQSLPADRPVIIQEEGVAYEAKGGWMALAPEQHNKTQDVYVISLTEESGEIPEYLRAQLQKNGLHLKDIVLPTASPSLAQTADAAPKEILSQIKRWPRDKREMVDALLFSFGVPFASAESISVQLHDGLRIEARSDRMFELAGKKTALFFQRPDADIVKAIQDIQGVRTVSLDLASLSSRELINRILNLLGDTSAYREHRFPAAKGAAKDRLTVTAWGFHLPQRSMFVTDRQIPAGLQRFFFEKGLEIVYFQ